ncbi:MAG: hypothetical protein ACLQLG_08915 [Thermoguttaceae bacterium]
MGTTSIVRRRFLAALGLMAAGSILPMRLTRPMPAPLELSPPANRPVVWAMRDISMAQTTGLTVEKFSALAYAARRAGLSNEDLAASLRKLPFPPEDPADAQNRLA